MDIWCWLTAGVKAEGDVVGASRRVIGLRGRQRDERTEEALPLRCAWAESSLNMSPHRQLSLSTPPAFKYEDRAGVWVAGRCGRFLPWAFQAVTGENKWTSWPRGECRFPPARLLHHLRLKYWDLIQGPQGERGRHSGKAGSCLCLGTLLSMATQQPLAYILSTHRSRLQVSRLQSMRKGQNQTQGSVWDDLGLPEIYLLGIFPKLQHGLEHSCQGMA